MASFTDNIPQFNPYVQQLPIEAMVQVGMQKQAQYDAGIQKIQSNIDQIAGLDIIRDSDKQYLQTKLNDLGEKLKGVAAGDFSNYQLVNSVGGMIKNVARDKTIQNAVYSTQKVRKGQEDMEAARKAGKSSPENEWFFNKQLSDYLSSSDPSATFSSQFIQFTDVGEKLRQVAEKIKEVDSSIDIPYQRNADGSPKTDEKGNPMIDEAMLTIKTKGKSAEKILANFYSSLDENDKQQLFITSNYHYRNATKDTFINDIAKNYQDKKKNLSESITELNVELKTNPKLTAAQRSQKEAQIKAATEMLNSNQLDTEMAAEIQAIENTPNLDDFKYRVYTQKYLNNLAQDMSYQSYIQELKNNPYAQIRLDKQKLQFQYDNMNRQQRNWEMDFALNQQKAALEQAKFAYTVRKDQLDQGQITVPVSISTEVDTPSLAKLDTEINSISDQMKMLDAKYASIITGENTPEGRKKELEKLMEQYNENPSAFINAKNDPNLAKYLEQRRALEISKMQKQNLYNSAVEASKAMDQEIEQVLANTPSYKDSAGRVYTAKQLFDIGNQFVNLPEKERDALIANSESRLFYNKALQVYRDNYNKLRDVASKRSAFQSEFLAARMPERQRLEGTLSMENKANASSINSLLGVKMSQFSKEGALDTPGMENIDIDVLQELSKDKNTKYVLSKAYDGSGSLKLISGSTVQDIPLSAEEFSTFFPQHAPNNPMQTIKDMVNGSPQHTTNALGKKDSAGAVTAYLSGYQLPALANTPLASTVRVDIEGDPDNDGSANDQFAIRLYVDDGTGWKTNIITPTFKNHEETLQIISNIGTATVQEFLKKNK